PRIGDPHHRVEIPRHTQDPNRVHERSSAITEICAETADHPSRRSTIAVPPSIRSVAFWWNSDNDRDRSLGSRRRKMAPPLQRLDRSPPGGPISFGWLPERLVNVAWLLISFHSSLDDDFPLFQTAAFSRSPCRSEGLFVAP